MLTSHASLVKLPCIFRKTEKGRPVILPTRILRMKKTKAATDFTDFTNFGLLGRESSMKSVKSVAALLKPGFCFRSRWVSIPHCSPSIRSVIQPACIMILHVFGAQSQRKQSHKDEGAAQGKQGPRVAACRRPYLADDSRADKAAQVAD